MRENNSDISEEEKRREAKINALASVIGSIYPLSEGKLIYPRNRDGHQIATPRFARIIFDGQDQTDPNLVTNLADKHGMTPDGVKETFEAFDALKHVLEGIQNPFSDPQEFSPETEVNL